MEGRDTSRNIAIKKYLAKWFSFRILNLSDIETKKCFRTIEKVNEKLTKKRLDIEFNIKCLDNGLLPNYTNK